VICADGKIEERELMQGRKMVKAEGIDENKFETLIKNYTAKDKEHLYNECVSGLKMLDQQRQIRCLSWMCVIANSDGFMDRDEWILIYKIYNNELGLSLDDIMKTQRELNKILHGREFISFGIKTDN
jgi:uncharacterized tellurite resistance protein B-like protein